MFATQPNRTLLNPKFEGYKLDPLDEAAVVRRHPLVHHPKQTTASGRTPLSFREVQSRIRHNHLVPAPDGRSAVYIDGDLRVIQIWFDDNLTPTYSVLYELPVPIATDAAEDQNKEYASAAFADDSTLFVADGSGTLYAFALDGEVSDLRGTYELPSTSSTSPRAFKIHLAARTSPDAATLILSSAVRVRESAPSSPSTSRTASTVEFDISAFLVPISTSEQDTASPLVLWRLRGADAPLYVAYAPPHEAFLLAGSEPYRALSAPPRPPSPNPADTVPLPSSPSAASGPAPPPLYAWTQDDEEVTVAIPLPASTSSSSISVYFSPQSVTVRAPTAPVSLTLSAARLWAPISPSSCFWTWDAAGSDTGASADDQSTRHGLLMLHIEKAHAQTRWPSLFAPNAVPHALDVAETLDPSALAHIRDVLDKFTADAHQQQGSAPSLSDADLDAEADEDAEAASGAVLTWARAADGAPPDAPWARADADSTLGILATSLPGTDGSTGAISFVTKHTIDGLLFARDSDGSWTHVRTHPALAFVLASKRDARFVHHVHVPGSDIASGAVLALESGAGAYGGNAYVYRAPGTRAVHAPQAILRVSGASTGALLGVAAVREPGSGVLAIACLCETELVVLRGVL